MSNLIPDGNVRAIYRAYDVGMTRNGNEQLVLLFEVADEPNKGRELTWMGTFTEASFAITHRVLVAMGWKGEALETFKDDVRPGKMFNVYVGHETFEGKERNRIQSVKPPGMLSLRDSLRPEQRRALADRVKSMIAGGVHLQSAPGVKGAPEDDIPF
jgi:uncharacterized protein DUF669